MDGGLTVSNEINLTVDILNSMEVSRGGGGLPKGTPARLALTNFICTPAANVNCLDFVNESRLFELGEY